MVHGRGSRRAHLTGNRSGTARRDCQLPDAPLCRALQAPVAQRDRAPDYESGGRRFESFRARQLLLEIFTALEALHSFIGEAEVVADFVDDDMGDELVEPNA